MARDFTTMKYDLFEVKNPGAANERRIRILGASFYLDLWSLGEPVLNGRQGAEAALERLREEFPEDTYIMVTSEVVVNR